jgi:hypothetical protein
VKHSAEKKANVFEQLPLFYCMTTSGQAFSHLEKVFFPTYSGKNCHCKI